MTLTLIDTTLSEALLIPQESKAKAFAFTKHALAVVIVITP